MKRWIKLSCVAVLLSFNNFVYADDQSNSALRYFQVKAAANQLPAAYIAYKNKEYQKALDIYKHFADQGNPIAQFMLGYFSQNGIGAPVDNLLAVAWYMKANAQGLPEAQYALGLMYYYGIGVSQGVTQAFDLFTQAAQRDNPQAQYMLGYMSANGFGATKDPT